MAIQLSKAGCIKNNVSIGEILFLLAVYNNINLDEVKDSLISKGLISSIIESDLFINTFNSPWRVTNKGITLINNVIVDSDENLNAEDVYKNIAIELKNIFPKGKKEGTNYYWSEGIPLIVKRLKMFFKLYGNQFTENQIINAAKKYVESFNGNYSYMRLLKYFILKNDKDATGCIDEKSELITYIENEGQEDTLKNNWTSTLK